MIADVFSAVAAANVLKNVSCKLGQEFIGQHTDPGQDGRVVWVPTRDAFRRGKVQAGRPVNSRDARALLTRIAGVNIHLWAHSGPNVDGSVAAIAAVEELARKVLVAIHEKAFGSYEAVGLVWPGSDDGEAPMMQFGRSAVLQVTFEMPVARLLADDNSVLQEVVHIQAEGREDFPPLSADTASSNDLVETTTLDPP